MDAGHARLPRRVGAGEPAPAVRRRRRPAAGVPLRLPVRQHRGRHLPREEVRPGRAALSRLARGPGDLRSRADRSAARLRARLPLSPGSRRRGPQLFRAPSAGPHVEYRCLGHSYWESRFETHLGDAYAKEAKELILQDHTPSDTHLDTIISPTLFSVRTSRRLFRGMVHLTESESWRWAFQMILENTRWDLPDDDV